MSVNKVNGPQSGGLEKDNEQGVSIWRHFFNAAVFLQLMGSPVGAKANDNLTIEQQKLIETLKKGGDSSAGFTTLPIKIQEVLDIEKIGNIKTAQETSTFNTSFSGFSAQSNNGEIKQRFSTNVGASTSTTKDSLSDSEQDKIESPSKNGGKTVTNNAQIEGLTDWGSWQANIGLVNQISENEKSATIREASISFLYNAAKAETMIKVAKGSDFEKILIAQGISLGEGGKLALNVSKLSQILNYNFDSYGSKDVSMEQNTYGIKYTYPAKMGFLEELRTKVIYYDVKGKELGTIKDIIINNATEYDWTEINGAVQGGTALRGIAEVVLKLDEKVKLTLGVGLDKTKYEAILDRAAETQTKVTGSVNLEWLVNNYNDIKLFLYENPNDTRFGAKLTHLFDAGFTGYIQLEQDSYKNNIGRDNEVKGLVGFNYTFGKGSKKLPSLYSEAGDTKLRHGESLISEVDTNYISGPNRAIAQKMHIVFVDKTFLLPGDGITVDPITQKLISIYYDNGGNAVTSISGLSDTSYSNFFFVENSKLTIKNFRDLAYKMAKDGIALGSTKTIDVGVTDAGGNSIYDVKIVKGSAEFRNVTRRVFGVTTAVMNAFVNGTLDPRIKEDLLNAVLTPAVVDGIVTGLITQTQVNQYKNGDLTATDLANLLHPDHIAPTANGETVSTAYNTSLNGINVLANDSDNSGTVILGNISSQVGGVFTKSGNLINFTPTNGFSGAASCLYEVKDPTGNTSTVTLTVNVGAPDTTPNSFDILDITNQALSTVITTNAITVTGINASTTVSTNVGTLVINGTDTGLNSSTVSNGQTVAVKLTTGATNNNTINGTLNIGGVTDNFSVTTLAIGAPASAPGSLDMTTATDGGTDTTDNITNLDSAFTWVSVLNATSYEIKLNSGSRTDVGNVLTYATSGLADGTYTFSVRAKNGSGTSTDSTINFTKDTVTPNTPTWTVGRVTLKNTAYTARKVTLAVGASGINPTGLSVTAGGTISNVSVSGGVVTFDYTTPNAVGDTITISGTSVAGTAFSTTIDTPALSSPVDAERPNTPTLTINSGATYTNSTNVNIAITGDTDNVGVTGWFVSESSSVPALGSFVAKPTTANISSGDGTKTLYVFTRDAIGNISFAGNRTITLDTVTPNTPTWTVGRVTLKNTAYTARKVTLAVGASGINPTGLSVTAGGTISNVSVSGGVVTFDYTTPNAVGDTITISGTSVAGTAFSTTIDTPALSAANVAPVVLNIGDTLAGNTYFSGDNHRETTVDMSSYISDDITADSGLTFNYTGNAGISSIDTSAWPTIKIIGNIGWTGPLNTSYTVTDAGGLTSNTGTINTNW